MSNFDIHWKFKNYEIHIDSSVTAKEPHVELIMTDEHNKPFTLAYWNRGHFGEWCLTFVCERPMEYISEININEIWKQLFLVQQMFEDSDLH